MNVRLAEVISDGGPAHHELIYEQGVYACRADRVRQLSRVRTGLQTENLDGVRDAFGAFQLPSLSVICFV